MDTMITTYNTAVTDAASEILGKERRRKKPWVTKDVLDLCDDLLPLFQEGQLSVTGESMCTKYWLTA